MILICNCGTVILEDTKITPCKHYQKEILQEVLKLLSYETTHNLKS